MSWSNDVISEFLTLYEQEPIIWNPKHDGHKDRNAVHDSWIRIQRELSITCTIGELKKKKETLMATFRKLHTKVRASMKTGSNADDVFKPDWFAYKQMAKFLQSIYSPRTTKSLEEHSDTEYRENEIQDQTSTNADTFKAPGSSKVLNNKKRKIAVDEKETLMDEAYSYLKDLREKPDKDECSLFSELLCQKLRALDNDMRDIAMHEIDCLMFRFKQQQHVGYFQQQVPSFQSHTKQFLQPSRSQPSPGFPPSPNSHSQPSPGFSNSPNSHSEPSPIEQQSSHSQSQHSPPLSPAQIKAEHFSDESYEETLDCLLED